MQETHVPRTEEANVLRTILLYRDELLRIGARRRTASSKEEARDVSACANRGANRGSAMSDPSCGERPATRAAHLQVLDVGRRFGHRFHSGSATRASDDGIGLRRQIIRTQFAPSCPRNPKRRPSPAARAPSRRPQPMRRPARRLGADPRRPRGARRARSEATHPRVDAHCSHATRIR